jgi:hypothetical protein
MKNIFGSIYRLELDGQPYIAFPSSRINTARIVVVACIIVIIIKLIFNG